MVPGPLSTRKTDTPFSNDGLVTVGQKSEIPFQLAHFDNLIVPVLIHFSSEQYILPDRTSEEPRLLRCICYLTVDLNFFFKKTIAYYLNCKETGWHAKREKEEIFCSRYILQVYCAIIFHATHDSSSGRFERKFNCRRFEFLHLGIGLIYYFFTSCKFYFDYWTHQN